MLEILPVKLLSEDDTMIFGRLNVELGKLSRDDVPVASGLVITPPALTIQTVLNHFVLGDGELFEQSLILVKKELVKQSAPLQLKSEIKTGQSIFIDGKTFTNVNLLWSYLIDFWLDEIKQRIWLSGFSPEIAKNLTPANISLVKKVTAFGEAYFDELTDEVVVNVQFGALDVGHYKKLADIILAINKKLLIRYSYQWVLDTQLKLVGLSPYAPNEDTLIIKKSPHEIVSIASDSKRNAGVTKVFLDLSQGFVIESEVDGAFIAAEKIINLNNQEASLEELTFKLTETAKSLPQKNVLFKLPDIPETLGGVRGTLRLLHQESLFKPLVNIIKFVIDDKKLTNVQLVIPFLRNSNEYTKLIQKLSKEGVSRDYNLQFWMEVAVGENLLNLDDYLKVGIDGVVLNLDELIGSLYGFDHAQEHFAPLKKETTGLVKFLEGFIRKLKKAKIPVIAYGSMVYDISLLEFLVHQGVGGIIVERYEAISMRDLLYKIEKKMALKRTKE